MTKLSPLKITVLNNLSVFVNLLACARGSLIFACLHRSRKENLQLSSEYNKLQESYKHLEALKTKLASSETAWRMNLTDAQKDAEKTKQEVREPSSSPLSTLPLTTSTPKAVQQFLPEANKIQVARMAFVLCVLASCFLCIITFPTPEFCELVWICESSCLCSLPLPCQHSL